MHLGSDQLQISLTKQKVYGDAAALRHHVHYTFYTPFLRAALFRPFHATIHMLLQPRCKASPTLFIAT